MLNRQNIVVLTDDDVRRALIDFIAKHDASITSADEDKVMVEVGKENGLVVRWNVEIGGAQVNITVNQHAEQLLFEDIAGRTRTAEFKIDDPAEPGEKEGVSPKQT